jgi:inner membrane protein
VPKRLPTQCCLYLIAPYFVSAVFKSRKLTALLSLLLVLMYGFIFILLQLEDYSLLIGSIVLYIPPH